MKENKNEKTFPCQLSIEKSAFDHFNNFQQIGPGCKYF